MVYIRTFLYTTCFLVLLPLIFSACDGPTYPEEKVKKSIKEICLKEYDIKDVEVIIKGKTVGVFLPLNQLFHSDFEHVLATGKVKNIENLLQFSPEAMEKVEDVLFSTSRVMLSTDSHLDFYLLKAIDTEVTGIELVLLGYVDDVKRVRFWDIPRSEYRERVSHDLKINRAVIWNRPVQHLFKDMNQLQVVELLDKYFISGTNLNMISPFFYSYLLESQFKKSEGPEIVDIRSIAFKQNQALVYVKLKEEFKPKEEYSEHEFLIPSEYETEFLFVLVQQGNQYQISRVIPFDFKGPDGNLQKIKFPQELKLYENFENWATKYELEEVTFPGFLAKQLSRRAGNLMFSDERIENTLGKVKPEIVYNLPEEKTDQSIEALDQVGYFSFKTALEEGLVPDVLPQVVGTQNPEDVNYYVDTILRLIGKVLRAYSFKDFSGIEIELPFSSEKVFVDTQQLEQIRRKKADFQNIFPSVV